MKKHKVTRWRQRTKLKAIKYKGEKCIRCGYNKCPAALCFHHRIGKDFKVGGSCRSWEIIKKELDKCDLLCHNCHMEIHYMSS